MRCKLHLLQRRKQKQFRLTLRCAILGAIMAVIMGLQIFLRLVARVCLEFVERSGDSAQRFVVASEDIRKRDREKMRISFLPRKRLSTYVPFFEHFETVCRVAVDRIIGSPFSVANGDGKPAIVCPNHLGYLTRLVALYPQSLVFACVDSLVENPSVSQNLFGKIGNPW